MQLDDVQGFVFDIDGSLVHRDEDFNALPLPGSVEVLEAIRASGRPYLLFTNGSHMPPADFAQGLREGGLPIGDDEVMTPVESAIAYLERNHPGARTHVFGSESSKGRIEAAGFPFDDSRDAEVVVVLHLEEVSLDALKRAARAVLHGAPLLTANYGPGFWGKDELVFSTGAMATAAIAKVTEAVPIVVGKPSKVAIEMAAAHLGAPPEKLLVVGDDVDMDVALGHLGGAKTILVRSGTSGSRDLSTVPEERRPHEVVDGVGELLDRL